MNSVMQKLKYDNIPSKNTYGNYRSYLKKVSNSSCSYCTITESESPGATFNIDHFRPIKYFPELKDECSNLRYSCPRCNSYKTDKWISNESGCIKDCENCHTKACKTDIFRFVNCLEEDPEKMIVLDEEEKLVAINGSKPAEYTIKYLRLNRLQLLKLRTVRRELDLWKEELSRIKAETEQHIVCLEKEYDKFCTENSISSFSEKETTLFKIAAGYCEINIMTWKHQLEFINEQINRLDAIINYRMGDDSTWQA